MVFILTPVFRTDRMRTLPNSQWAICQTGGQIINALILPNFLNSVLNWLIAGQLHLTASCSKKMNPQVSRPPAKVAAT